MVCAYTLGVTSPYLLFPFGSPPVAFHCSCEVLFLVFISLFGICCWVAAMNPHFVTLGSNQAVQGGGSRTVSIVTLDERPISRKSEQAPFADVVADLAPAVDAQQEDVPIDPSCVISCHFLLSQFEIEIFGRTPRSPTVFCSNYL